MELDWSTFVLEIVNVLVLVWLLKRFLYRPVLNVIEERKAAIAKSVADANRLQSEAKALREQYDQRLFRWEQEREERRVQLQEDLATERQRRLTALQDELEKEREQASARTSQQMKVLTRQAETTAILHGTRFTSALLKRFAGPDLELMLVKAALGDLSQLSDVHIEGIRVSLPKDVRARVTTAYPLEESSRNLVMETIEKRFARPVFWEFDEDPQLLAGLRLSLGAWVLRGNLLDELAFFAEGENSG